VCDPKPIEPVTSPSPEIKPPEPIAPLEPDGGIKGIEGAAPAPGARCPHCDGPLYKGKGVAVIGGGNSGVEPAIDLAGVVQHVTLIEFADQFKADAVLVRKLKSLPNVEIHVNAQTTEITGDGQKVDGLVDTRTVRAARRTGSSWPASSCRSDWCRTRSS
jgi:hypothetical protein